MSKQTALQWFMDKLPHSIETQFSKQIQQAMQMEREQIQDAFYHGIAIDAFNVKDKWTEAEKYYQDEVGKCIAEAIDEKIKRDFGGEDE
jgi:tRNA U54 and U55 pseudouridine synthase Pus10